VEAPILGVPRLRLAAARETVDVAFNLVPVGEDAGRSADGDGVVFPRPLLLLLLPLCCFALGLFDRRSGRQSVRRLPRLPRHLELLSFGSLDQRPRSRQHLCRRLSEFSSRCVTWAPRTMLQ
jgi:hypothetical protein